MNPALRVLVLLSVTLAIVGCGGGGGGASNAVSISSSTSSLTFTTYAGESMSTQSVDVTLTNAPGTVYGVVASGDTSLVTAGWSLTGPTTGSIVVTPVAGATEGTFHTTLSLNI